MFNAELINVPCCSNVCWKQASAKIITDHSELTCYHF